MTIFVFTKTWETLKNYSIEKENVSPLKFRQCYPMTN